MLSFSLTHAFRDPVSIISWAQKHAAVSIRFFTTLLFWILRMPSGAGPPNRTAHQHQIVQPTPLATYFNTALKNK